MSAISRNKFVKGLDVSELSGDVDFEKVYQADCHFAFIKATQGETRIDTRFEASWSGAKQAGLIRSPYHELSPPSGTKSVLAQARHFVDTIEQHYSRQNGDLPPTLVPELKKRWKNFSKLQMTETILEFAMAVHARLGVAPVVRVNVDPSKEIYSPDELLRGLQLWVEHHSVARPFPKLPKPFKHWYFWRYTGDVSFPGVPEGKTCGLNFFNGNLEQLVCCMTELA